MNATAPSFERTQRGRFLDRDTTLDERSRAMLAHLLGMLGLIDMFLLGLIGSVVIYLTGRGESGYVEDHAREAVNFQLSMLVYTFAGVVFIIATIGLGALLVVPLLLGLWIIRLVVGVGASVAANRGEYYRYPICLRFLR